MNLILELQVSESTTQPMRTKAWLSLQLFTHNCLLESGAWRLPFLALPIIPSATLKEAAGHPRYFNAVMHMRVTNHMDSIQQSQVYASPSNRLDYFDPHFSLVSLNHSH